MTLVDVYLSPDADLSYSIVYPALVLIKQSDCIEMVNFVV